MFFPRNDSAREQEASLAFVLLLESLQSILSIFKTVGYQYKAFF